MSSGDEPIISLRLISFPSLSVPMGTLMDDNGKDHKAFLMPQKHPRKFYDNQFNSYNIPEFITGEVKTDQRMIQELVW